MSSYSCEHDNGILVFQLADPCKSYVKIQVNVLLFIHCRAALGGHAYICQTLIKFGIDPNVRDSSG